MTNTETMTRWIANVRPLLERGETLIVHGTENCTRVRALVGAGFHVAYRGNDLGLPYVQVVR